MLPCFNPQPPRKTAATIRCRARMPPRSAFQSSAAPKDGCNLDGRVIGGNDLVFQSSAAPKDGCNPDTRVIQPVLMRFQSSAAPKDGCNSAHARLRKREVLFQSSAAPKDGCNSGAGRRRLPRRWFQSSAAPKDGCNLMISSLRVRHRVSILSRPERRLQRFTVRTRPRRFPGPILREPPWRCPVFDGGPKCRLSNFTSQRDFLLCANPPGFSWSRGVRAEITGSRGR